MVRKSLVRSFLVGALLPAVLLAGKITLKDGTVYEGEIKKLGASSYTVRLADGTLKVFSAGQVKSVDDPTINGASSSGAASGGAATGGAASGSAVPAGPSTDAPAGASPEFQQALKQADKVESPVAAVTIWSTYLDKHKTAKDLPLAQKELDKWQAMVKEGAEKVNGKWMSGDELKKLHKQVTQMYKEASKMLSGDQTLKGISKLEEILKIYPQSFDANFELGYLNLIKITRMEGSTAKIDASIKNLETALNQRPTSPACLSNLAIAYSWRKKYMESVMSAYKAAQLEDSTEIVQNLFTALDRSPPGMLKNNPKVTAILPDAKILISRRGAKEGGGWFYIRPHGDDSRDSESPGEKSSRKGIIGSGTGFFISNDGYIMTNRHVAAAGDKMIVRMSDGKQRVAEKVVVDDDQDIAILKIKNDAPLPFIHYASYDEPPVGTDVTVMGFPLGDAFGQHVKITRGVVTSIEDDKDAPCDVIVDAQVNPGNSGGPMLDKYGNVLALVAMKTGSDEKVSSYGLGISSGRLRTFFKHQAEKLKDLKLEAAPKTGPSLSTEEIAKNYTQSTVMIMIVNGEAELPDPTK